MFATELDPPFRQTVVALQREQIRSPAHALSNGIRQLRQRRSWRSMAEASSPSCARRREWATGDTLDSSGQKQDDHDDENEAQAAAGIIPPTRTVRPSWQRT